MFTKFRAAGGFPVNQSSSSCLRTQVGTIMSRGRCYDESRILVKKDTVRDCKSGQFALGVVASKTSNPYTLIFSNGLRNVMSQIPDLLDCSKLL